MFCRCPGRMGGSGRSRALFCSPAGAFSPRAHPMGGEGGGHCLANATGHSQALSWDFPAFKPGRRQSSAPRGPDGHWLSSQLANWTVGFILFGRMYILAALHDAYIEQLKFLAVICTMSQKCQKYTIEHILFPAQTTLSKIEKTRSM